MRHVFGWLGSLAVILVVASALYLARGSLVPRLEALPDLAPPPPEAPPPPPPPPEAAPVAVEPEPEPLTFAEMEAMLEPLPSDVLGLVASAREELQDFGDLGVEDKVKAERAQRFFLIWIRTWFNRLDQLQERTPPFEECRVHAALEPGCAMLERAYKTLRAVAASENLEVATARLDRVEEMVDLYLNPPPPPEEEGGEGTEAAEGDEESG